MKSASEMSKNEVIDFLVKCGIWVKGGKIAKADLDRAKVALENMKDETANIEHGQNPENVEKFEKPQDAVASSVVMTKDTPSGKVELIDGDEEWRIRLPDGTLKGMATKHLNIDQAKKYFLEMPVEKMSTAAIDKNLLKTLRDDINEALKPIGEKHGVSINAGNASFSSDMATFKLEIMSRGEGGETQSKHAIEFKRYAKILGMKEEDLGKEFTLNGKKFTFTGYLPKGVKYSMVAKGEDGREYKLEEAPVKKALGY